MNRSAIVIACFILTGMIGCNGAPSGTEASTNEVLGEEYSGGETTVFANTLTAFSQPASNLTAEQVIDFQVGNSFFEQDWVQAPSSTTARDGLGPYFNARSCSACHARDGRGEPFGSDGDSPALLLRLSVPGTGSSGGPVAETNYGLQLSTGAILGVNAEGSFTIDYDLIPGTFPDGEPYELAVPSYTIADLLHGDLDSQALVSPRIAQQMIGMGLLEAIPEGDILANADEDDADGDGISGKANSVLEVISGQLTLGRFGWKANQPSVQQQVAGAFAGDIGITSSIFPDNECHPDDADCMAAPNGGEPEIEDDILEFVVFYSKTLAVPARRNVDETSVSLGAQLFSSVGCAQCHVTTFTTDANYPIAELAGQTIHPYTDLLLHDMGDDLADDRPDFLATGSEWRTPPLWGIGLIPTVNGHSRYLHDGRARNLQEAILWHGGEALQAKTDYMNLTAEQRAAIISFLESL